VCSPVKVEDVWDEMNLPNEGQEVNDSKFQSPPDDSFKSNILIEI